MRASESLVALIALFEVMAPGGVLGLEARSGPAGHVFLEGEELVFAFAWGEDEQLPESVRVVDYDGNTVSSAAPASKLALSALPKGYYELWARDMKLTSVAVVPHLVSRVHGGSRLAAACGFGELIKQKHYADAAELVRRAGFKWAREGITWMTVAPERGKLKWGKYDRIVDEEQRRGILVQQLFCNVPKWARADSNWKAYPDDLRDVFRFARSAAEHFRGSVRAWDIWNEADHTNFSKEMGDEYAAFCKAAALGFRRGNPDVKLLMTSLALAPGRFADSIFQNGIAPYTDVYNWHSYYPPRDYAARTRAHLAMMARHGIAGRQMWLSEAGISLPDHGGSLSPEDERRRVQFIPKSCALSLASGVNKYFWFIFPHYVENGFNYGALNHDLTPRPTYVALATLTYALGHGEYRGRVNLGMESAQVHVFERGDGSRAAVCWTDGAPVDVRLKTEAASVTRLSVVGTPGPLEARKGALRVTLSKAPFYLLLGHGHVADVVPAAPRPVNERPAITTDIPAIVLRWRFPSGLAQKRTEAYVLPTDEAVRIELQAYNFGTERFSGRVLVSGPKGWKLSELVRPVSLQPMSMVARTLSLTPRWNDSLIAQRLEAVAVAGKSSSTPAVARVRWGYLAGLAAAERMPLAVSRPEVWADSISGNGVMSHTAGPEGGIRFDIRFTNPGVRWAYPLVGFEPPLDLSRYHALRWEYRCDTDNTKTVVRVQFFEPNGAAYLSTGLPARTQWQQVTLLFDDLIYGEYSRPDMSFKFDPDKVSALRVGVNTSDDRVLLDVRNVEAVRFAKLGSGRN